MTRPGAPAPHDTWMKRAELRGEAYVVSAKETVTSGGGTLNIHLKNPSGSDKLLHLFDVVGGTQFQGEFIIYDDFSSSPFDGSSVNIDNMRMDAENNGPDDGNMVANQNVSFTANEPHFETVISSGGAGGNQVGGKLQSTLPIIEPSREIVFELTNDSTENDKGSIGIVYFEE